MKINFDSIFLINYYEKANEDGNLLSKIVIVISNKSVYTVQWKDKEKKEEEEKKKKKVTRQM